MLLARNQTLISLASEGGTHGWNGSNAHYTLLNYTAVAVCGGECDCVCVKRGEPFATNIYDTGRNGNDVLSLGGFV